MKLLKTQKCINFSCGELSFILSVRFSWAPPLPLGLHIFSLLLPIHLTIIILEPCALNAEYQHFIVKFPYFADTTERGDRGWKEAQRQGEERVTLGLTLMISPKSLYYQNWWFSELQHHPPLAGMLMYFFAGFFFESHPVYDQTQGSGAVFFLLYK